MGEYGVLAELITKLSRKKQFLGNCASEIAQYLMDQVWQTLTPQKLQECSVIMATRTSAGVDASHCLLQIQLVINHLILGEIRLLGNRHSLNAILAQLMQL